MWGIGELALGELMMLASVCVPRQCSNDITNSIFVIMMQYIHPRILYIPLLLLLHLQYHSIVSISHVSAVDILIIFYIYLKGVKMRTKISIFFVGGSALGSEEKKLARFS